MLEIKGLKVIRGNFNVTLPELYIADGQCVALCGVSGSGKSTLMEAIGLLSPFLAIEHFILDDIEVDELNERDLEALRISEIGIMPQVGGLLPFLTVKENIKLQIALALKQKIKPVFPDSSNQDKLIPNTTVALQEAQERAVKHHQEEHEVVCTLRKTKKMCRRFKGGLVPVKLINEKLEKEHQHALEQENISPYEMMVKDLEFTGDSIDSHCIDGPTENLKEEAARKYALIPETRRQYARSLIISNEANKDRIEAAFVALSVYIERLGLSEHLDKLPEQLSIGQRQRALFLRAIAHQPRLLLIDEPTSALDPENADKLFKLIGEIASKTHTSVLIITHDHKAVSNYRRYEYDAKSSHEDYSVFVSAQDNEPNEDIALENDLKLMSEMTIDYPAASGLSRSINEYGSGNSYERNIVKTSSDNVFHEISNVVDHHAQKNTKVSKAAYHEQGHHMHYGYAHNTNHYGFRTFSEPRNHSEYELLASNRLGGYTKINDRISIYTTPMDRLQSILRKSEAQAGRGAPQDAPCQAMTNPDQGQVPDYEPSPDPMSGPDYESRPCHELSFGHANAKGPVLSAERVPRAGFKLDTGLEEPLISEMLGGQERELKNTRRDS